MRVVTGTLIYLVFSNVCCGKITSDQKQHAEETDKKIEQVVETLTSEKDKKTDNKRLDTGHATRIVNGSSAQRGEYPWMVSLFANEYFFCGGSILNARTILTAAHCVETTFGWNVLQVRAGDHVLRRKDKYEQRVFVEEVIVHPEYTFFTTWDIAILKLKKDLEYNDYVQPISIPTPREEYYLSSFGRCTLSGFGQRSYPEQKFPRVLQELDSRIARRSFCSRTIRLDFPTAVFNKYLFCSYHPGRGVCYGDSGGPYVCYNNDDTPYQVGIMSWISSNCWTGFNVYTRVSRYARWIEQYI